MIKEYHINNKEGFPVPISDILTFYNKYSYKEKQCLVGFAFDDKTYPQNDTIHL